MQNLFTSRLLELRGDRTQAVFAESLGFSTTTYGRYEVGTREPSIEDIYQIGVKTSSNLNWLLGLVKEPQKIRIAPGTLANKEYALDEDRKNAELKTAEINQAEMILKQDAEITFLRDTIASLIAQLAEMGKAKYPRARPAHLGGKPRAAG